jgi:hypothetical protein
MSHLHHPIDAIKLRVVALPGNKGIIQASFTGLAWFNVSPVGDGQEAIAAGKEMAKAAADIPTAGSVVWNG